VRPPRAAGGCEPVQDNLQIGGLFDDTTDFYVFHTCPIDKGWEHQALCARIQVATRLDGVT